MIWATLAALLGIPLWLIGAFGFFTWWRFRIVRKDPRSIRAALRLVEGELADVELANVKEKWKRGYVAWESDVLIWVPVPSLLKLTAVQTSSAAGFRSADPGEVKRMGDSPRLARLTLAAGPVLELAFHDEDSDRALGPFHSGTASSPDVMTA